MTEIPSEYLRKLHTVLKDASMSAKNFDTTLNLMSEVSKTVTNGIQEKVAEEIVMPQWVFSLNSKEVQKQIRQRSVFVEPVMVKLGTRTQPGLRSGSSVSKRVDEQMAYFPISKIVKAVLSKKENFEKVIHESTIDGK